MDVKVEKRGSGDALEYVVREDNQVRAVFSLVRRKEGLGIYKALYEQDVETDKHIIDFRKRGFCARLMERIYANRYASALRQELV